jgi:hypothetical protein
MKILFALATFLTSMMAMAGGPTSQKQVPNYIGNSCVVDRQDAYEPHVRIDSGEYKGLCVNPTLRRSAVVLSASATDTVVANFSHRDQFWLAEIPVSKIEALYLQIEKFPLFGGGSIAHTQLRVVFAKGAQVQLKSQSSAQADQSGPVLDGMIFSVENISPYGELFDAFKGLFDQYRVAYRLVSLEQKYDWMIRQQGHEVRQYKLKLSPAQAQAVLREGLRRGTQHGISLAYNTLSKSCVTELFDITDRALGTKHLITPFFPNSVVAEFKYRGLLDEDSEMPLFNDESIGNNHD